MRTSVITIVAGRHDHLARQFDGLRAGLDQPGLHVVVAMGDAGVLDVPGRLPASTVLAIPAPERLPLAAARNVGAGAACSAGADLLIFLDVDCIPGPALVRRYTEAAESPHGRQLLSGPVHYLPSPPSGGYDLDRLAELAGPHGARPVPADDAVLEAADHRLFWSLSFAVRTPVWKKIGGFCEDYAGYGGEDTDFAEKANAAGIGLAWVGGATAYHQYHPVSQPPVEHVDDVLRNGAVFHRRWGWWPMRGWLDGFAELGLVRHDTDTDAWVRSEALR